MLSNHFFFGLPLLLFPSIIPSIIFKASGLLLPLRIWPQLPIFRVTIFPNNFLFIPHLHWFYSLSSLFWANDSRTTLLLPWFYFHQPYIVSTLLHHMQVQSTEVFANLPLSWNGRKIVILDFMSLVQFAVAVFVELRYLKLSTCSTFSLPIMMLHSSFVLTATRIFVFLTCEFQM